MARKMEDTSETQPKLEVKLSTRIGPVAHPSLAGAQEVKCGLCGYVIKVPSANFCPRCGANIRVTMGMQVKLAANTKIESEKRVLTVGEESEECIVCNLPLKQGDDVVWCPHCGRLAH